MKSNANPAVRSRLMPLSQYAKRSKTTAGQGGAGCKAKEGRDRVECSTGCRGRSEDEAGHERCSVMPGLDAHGRAGHAARANPCDLHQPSQPQEFPMPATSVPSTFDDPLRSEVESSDILRFEPVAHLDSDYATLAAFHGIEPQRLVLIDPHADASAPSWPAEKLAEVADGLAADGWQVAIVGDSCDAERTSLVLGAMQAGALYLAGAMTPDTLASLIGDARLILSENAEGSRMARVSGDRGTPLIHITAAGEAGHGDAHALVDEALAELHAQGAARPGAPFTLHTAALEDAA
jgi:Glycosyltransferase family 9 (heptosyltransferase)